MKFLKNKKFNNKEYSVTDEIKFLNRREIMYGFAGLATSLFSYNANSKNIHSDFTKAIDRDLTDLKTITKYNNFFEFGTSKQIWKSAQNLNLKDWKLRIEGGKYDNSSIYFDDLKKRFSMEERIYKFRCVEAWSMVVPWYGFELSKLISYLEPPSSTKYVSFQTFFNPEQAINQKQSWYPWPYTEIITIEEAMNLLSFLAIGIYGKDLPKQNGAPLRLVLPWKYGFKSIKSIVNIKFLENRIPSFWESIEPKEYGFWANVNPKVPHRRWSQEFEKDIGSGNKYPTEIFNGYSEWVENLYSRKTDKNLYF